MGAWSEPALFARRRALLPQYVRWSRWWPAIPRSGQVNRWVWLERVTAAHRPPAAPRVTRVGAPVRRYAIGFAPRAVELCDASPQIELGAKSAGETKNESRARAGVPWRVLLPVAAGTCLSLFGDATLYAVLPTHTEQLDPGCECGCHSLGKSFCPAASQWPGRDSRIGGDGGRCLSLLCSPGRFPPPSML